MCVCVCVCVFSWLLLAMTTEQCETNSVFYSERNLES